MQTPREMPATLVDGPFHGAVITLPEGTAQLNLSTDEGEVHTYVMAGVGTGHPIIDEEYAVMIHGGHARNGHDPLEDYII